MLDPYFKTDICLLKYEFIEFMDIHLQGRVFVVCVCGGGGEGE